jgi:homoserine kinase type II
LEGKIYTLRPTSGGVNNLVRYVDTEDGEQYLIRVYNNGCNFNKVQFEHAVLSQLLKENLSFQIPEVYPNPQNGEPFVHLSNGTAASLFKVIPGTLPRLNYAREIGEASGELSTVLGRITVHAFSPNPIYSDLYAAHYLINRELFMHEIKAPVFDPFRTVMNDLVAEILYIEKLIDRLLLLNLPTQWIHADLHYDNVLVHEGKVSGIVDFEFCVKDWRAMELAICLSKYSGEPDAMKYFDEFIPGYMKYAQLTPLEMRFVPDLIIVRILNNIVFFVGRAIAGEDDITTLTSRLETYCRRIHWLHRHRVDIIQKIEKASGNCKVVNSHGDN